VSAAPRTLVALVGATATGKSDLGEAVAAAVGGEVVCADARQVFGGDERLVHAEPAHVLLEQPPSQLGRPHLFLRVDEVLDLVARA